MELQAPLIIILEIQLIRWYKKSTIYQVNFFVETQCLSAYKNYVDTTKLIQSPHFLKRGEKGRDYIALTNEESSKYYSKQRQWDLPGTTPQRSQAHPEQLPSPAHCYLPKAGHTKLLVGVSSQLTQTACTVCCEQGADFCLLLQTDKSLFAFQHQKVEYLKVKRACVLTGKMKEQQHGRCAQSDGASLFYHCNFFGNYGEGEKNCLKTIQRARKEEKEPW